MQVLDLDMAVCMVNKALQLAHSPSLKQDLLRVRSRVWAFVAWVVWCVWAETRCWVAVCVWSTWAHGLHCSLRTAPASSRPFEAQ